MKKNGALIFTRILSILFVVGTIVVLLNIYGFIDSNITPKFITGYLLLTILFLLCVFFTIMLSLRELKWVDIKKRLFKFINLLIFFGVSNLIFNYIFRPSNVNILKTLTSGFALAVGISFMDLIFTNKID